MAVQRNFKFKNSTLVRDFGGSLAKGNPKTARPIAVRAPMHFVFRSTLATGRRSFLNFDRKIQALIRTQASRFSVRVYDIANAGNHLHCLFLITTRRTFAAFMSAITGLIARMVVRAERGRAWKLTALQKFWDARPFSRILTWGRDYRRCRKYLAINRVEMRAFDRLSAREIVKRMSAGGLTGKNYYF